VTSPADLVARCGLPRHEAERLLVVASGRSKEHLLGVTGLPAATLVAFDRLVVRRKRGEPLQYLEGTVQFGPLELHTDPRALIPRPETEQLWERVVARVRSEPPDVVVDLCTGSGNLALALKHEFAAADVWAVDLSSEAISLARENGILTELEVHWLEGDLFLPLPDRLRGRVDVIVSNPPYVAVEDFYTLPIDVRDHEPAGALVPGRYGDEALMEIAAGAADWLRPGGLLACEIGERQGVRVHDLFVAFDPEVEKDLAGRDRFVFGHKPVG
jgi:release factor glutamine methyltransferase